jgi:hypothetical protein
MHVDKHVVKMPLETAQILCTVHWQVGNQAPYKSTHKKHPCTIWAGQSIQNYMWLCELGLELCKEYTHRYAKTHKCEDIINWCIINTPNLPDAVITPYALAMPDEYKTSKDPIECYRNYYIGAKSHIHTWKNRQKPYWIN